MDQRTTRCLKRAATTTRGTPRQRTPNGFAQDLRLRVLKELPAAALDRALQGKLKRMSVAERDETEAQLNALSGDPRRDFIIRLLSQ